MDSSTEALLQESIRLHRQGALDEAVRGYTHVLQTDPANADAHYYFAVASLQRNHIDDAIDHAEKLLALNPKEARAHWLLGRAQIRLSRRAEALTSFDRAIAYAPDMAEAHGARADILAEMGRTAEAIASYDRALAIQPASISDWCNRGAALDDLGRHKEAIDCYDRVIALKPDFAEAYFNRGSALAKLMRYEKALADQDKALAIRPNYVEALTDRGLTLSKLDRFAEAITSFEKALAINPDFAEALLNRGNTLKKLEQFDAALASYDRALAVRPDYAEALFNRGNTLKELTRLDEALASYDRALTVKPDHAYAFSEAADCVIKLCDWDRRTRFAADLNTHVAGKKSIISPFTLLVYSDDPALQLQCARNFIEHLVPLLPPPMWQGELYSHERIRVAYISTDFRDHAVSHLLAGLFEKHDRARFETIAISLGLDDQSVMRARLKGAFERFIDVHDKSDRDVARLMRELEVDIAVDLMGFTAGAHPEILTHRAAPIQVNYLSYPGIIGTNVIDYILADRFVIPEDERALFDEPVVYLPDTYLGYDTTRKISERAPMRAELGLPETGFVFCAYNNSYKITPFVFDIWMRLLRAVEGSVLWLLGTNAITINNLRREAQLRHVDPGRLVFAQYVEHIEDHLARYRVANLFLDTLPFNAQTTACDALWVGLPVVTRLGETFVGRVAASMLNAIGLPELITHSAEEYEALALKLAGDPTLLAEIKAKLARNRDTYPLFNTDRFARHIEAAYKTMWEVWQRGEVPKSFSVKPI
jgi:predicted O-linked N-acetylglucosamine transferase (SPINDLY family)